MRIKENVYQFTRALPDVDAPKEATIYELASLGKVWARFGNTGSDPQTLVFIERQGYLHLYQKGAGRSDHLLFWITCCDVEESDDSLIIEMFGDSWSIDQ